MFNKVISKHVLSLRAQKCDYLKPYCPCKVCIYLNIYIPINLKYEVQMY